MRCIFCKKPSDSSSSEEHIIPESLGNRSHVLPPGIVCDACNNYFARKVEGPLLNYGPLRALRFEQSLRSKRDLVPSLNGILLPGIPAEIHARTAENPMHVVSVPHDALESIIRSDEGTLVLPTGGEQLDGRLWPRFLAKCSLEALALKFITFGLIHANEIVDHAGLDLIRKFARYGEPRQWPIFSQRRYDANHRFIENDQTLQRVFEFDLLMTTPENATHGGLAVSSEIYFILILFGHEFAINMGGPSIESYQCWLNEHQQQSPLYWGKNASL